MRREQRVVASVVLPAGAGGQAAGEPPAPAVVGHGEHPREAAIRSAAGDGLHVAVAAVREVTSTLEDAAGVGRHTLGVVYDGVLVASPPPPPPLVDRGRDGGSAGPPRVQRAGAYAVLHAGGRLLLTRLRSAQVWTLPGGGIDHGEDPLDAVRREVLEETGLELTSPRLLDVDSVHFTGHAPDGTLEDFHAVRILYAGEVPLDVEPRVVEVDGSTDAAAWVAIRDIGDRDRRRFEVALRHVG